MGWCWYARTDYQHLHCLHDLGVSTECHLHDWLSCFDHPCPSIQPASAPCIHPASAPCIHRFSSIKHTPPMMVQFQTMCVVHMGGCMPTTLLLWYWTHHHLHPPSQAGCMCLSIVALHKLMPLHCTSESEARPSLHTLQGTPCHWPSTRLAAGCCCCSDGLMSHVCVALRS